MAETDELTKAAAKWQKLLKLDEWQIGVGIGDKKTMQNQIGSISYIRETGQALITVLNKKEADTYPWTFNEEVALVRKLLDLRFEMIHCDEENRLYFERALRIIAELLVALDTRNTVLTAQKQQLQEDKPIKKLPRVIEG